MIGALGTITTRHKDFLPDLGIHVSFETIQKASLLATTHILRNGFCCTRERQQTRSEWPCCDGLVAVGELDSDRRFPVQANYLNWR